MNLWLALAGLNGAVAVAAGAAGAHALASRLSAADMQLFETAARYHMYHALALCAVALLAHGGMWPRLAGSGFLIGILLFCGALYAISLGGPRGLSSLAPIGGLAFIFGWLCLALAGLTRN